MKQTNLLSPPLKDYLKAAKVIAENLEIEDAKIVLDTSILNTRLAGAKRLLKKKNVYISEDTFYELQLLLQFRSGLFYKPAMKMLNLEYKKYISIDHNLDNILTINRNNLKNYIFIVPNRLRVVEYLESIFISPQSVVIYPDIDGKSLIYTTLKGNLSCRKAVVNSIKLSHGNINDAYSPAIGYSMNDEMKINGTKYSFFAKGGEGVLFESRAHNSLLKLYNRKLSPLKEEKIKHLINESSTKSYANNFTVFPNSFVKNHAHCGYTMKKINGVSLTEAFVNRSFLKTLSDNIDDILKKILYIVLELNLRGIILSDISSDNILIDKLGNAYFCDIDSCQICKNNKFYTSGCYRPKASSRKIAKIYEKYPQRLPSYVRTSDTDAFSLVVLFYEILMIGCPPLHAQGELGRANFYKNQFPLNPNTTTCMGVPKDVCDRWRLIDNKHREFYTNTFSGTLKPVIGTIVKTLLIE